MHSPTMLASSSSDWLCKVREANRMEREIVLVFLKALPTMTVETEAKKSFVTANLG